MRQCDPNFDLKINISQYVTQRLTSTSIYGPVILLHVLKTIWWRNVVLGIMGQCDTKIDLVKYMWLNDLYFMAH